MVFLFVFLKAKNTILKFKVHRRVGGPGGWRKIWGLGFLLCLHTIWQDWRLPPFPIWTLVTLGQGEPEGDAYS